MNLVEARITFPTDWVSGLAPIQQNKLSSILSEEQAWEDEANHKRDIAKPVALFFMRHCSYYCCSSNLAGVFNTKR